ncbi:MAG: FAD-binding protein [Coriobacteriales bacterium]|jgi:succinate dehydrogenase/fumarate reductase flavoprotein subunit|nr:FAD-binding protein [Coriobacteriales bacterium]
MDKDNGAMLDRRSFLGAAAVGAGVLGMTALTGCGAAEDGAGNTNGAAPIAAAGIPETWDRECDIVVIGSGSVLPAATYCAINGLETIVLEKAAWAGGTTITSGGKCYVPCSSLVPDDSREEALAFLTACNPHEFVTPAMIDAYLDEGSKMIDFLKDKANVNWQVFGTALAPSISGFGNVHGTLGVPREDNPDATTGSGFQQPQIDAIDNAGGEILLSTPAKRLVARQLEDGRNEVLGVIAEDSGKEISIKARKGVVIGTGSYDHNRDLCKQLLPYTYSYTWAIETCTGDGLLMALGVGGAISETNRGWGIIPEIYAIDAIEAGEPLPIYAQREDFNTNILGLPDGVSSYFSLGFGASPPIVSRMGQRFYKEPGNYSTMAAWGGIDAREEAGFQYRYMPYSFGIIDAETATKQGYDQLDPLPRWLSKGETFEELADAAGIDKYNLVSTMTRWQNDANNGGLDTEYGRKDIIPLGAGPYYAVKVSQYMQTTVGGIAVNEKAQVKAALGGVIPRLYATSTAAANCGIVYPSSGGSIGPGMIFAYVAAVDASSLEDWT